VGLKSLLARPYAFYKCAKITKTASHPINAQKKVFNYLMGEAKKTLFGKDHSFHKVQTYNDFKKYVPIRDYEELKPYIEKIKNGDNDVLWKGKPLYFAKTSGTTSGVKYIPLTKDSIPNHINSARNALLMYIHETGNTSFADGKMIFLQGSPEMENISGINTGRLSGIVYHFVPPYLLKNRLPSYKINCINDWETKVEAICRETLSHNMTLISGIPPWVIMYFEKLLEMSGKKTVIDIFPNFSLFVHGGVNYEPYRTKIDQLIGKKVPSIETYPASEGFIAYQDSQHEDGLLLNVVSGIFFEFIPANEIFNENPTRMSLNDVELNVNYALIINNNAGLWGYNIGDTIKFLSKHPYRIVVTGRIKHFISAFGEHIIGEEVEYALLKAAEETNTQVFEFTVAPQTNPPAGTLPYHEWFIEFDIPPVNVEEFSSKIDNYLRQKNIYYQDLVAGKILQPLKITLIEKSGFRNYMKSQGKLGGQNKVPRLSNDRSIADELQQWALVNKV
jgi:hypothetical protein